MIEKGPGKVALNVGLILMATCIISGLAGWSTIANVAFFASAVPIFIGLVINNS